MNGKTKTYEGMFLLDTGTGDFESASEPVRSVLARCEVEVLAIKPWDERKLAYQIKGRKRGLYVLSYFKADPARVAEIEHECQLNEAILRVLVLRRDHLSDEQIHAETPATAGSRKAREAKPAETETKEPEAKSAKPETTEPKAKMPQPDAKAPQPDAKAPQPDAKAPQPDEDTSPAQDQDDKAGEQGRDEGEAQPAGDPPGS